MADVESTSTERESDMEVSETDLPTERGRGRGRRGRSSGRGRGRGSSSRSGSRGRGRGRRQSKSPALSKTDRERVELKRKEKTDTMKDVVKVIDEARLRELVLKLIDREPGLIFDLLEVEDDGASPPLQPSNTNQLSWCKCGHCRQMPTELEKKCCGCLPQNCVSQREQMDRLVLDPQVLALGQRYHNEMLGRYRQPVENYNRTMRHSGYRNFTLWRHGRLGAGVRRVIPSCCVWRIRDVYPSPTNQYSGFQPSRFM